MKTINFFVLTAVVFISFWFSCAQDFILHRKKKTPSVSSQQCAEILGNIVHIFSDLIHECAMVQVSLAEEHREVLFLLNGYLNGDKECFLHNASKQQRADFYQKLITTKKELEDINKQFKHIKKTVKNHVATLQNI